MESFYWFIIEAFFTVGFYNFFCGWVKKRIVIDYRPLKYAFLFFYFIYFCFFILSHLVEKGNSYYLQAPPAESTFFVAGMTISLLLFVELTDRMKKELREIDSN